MPVATQVWENHKITISASKILLKKVPKRYSIDK